VQNGAAKEHRDPEPPPISALQCQWQNRGQNLMGGRLNPMARRFDSSIGSVLML
jgi:hypothetical protein